MNKPMKAIWVAAALSLGLSHPAVAQTLKKYITPDGKTVYSDTPVPGAKEVGEIKAQPLIDPSGRSQAQDTARKDAETAKSADQRLQESAAQRARVEAAETKLEDAKRALEEGKEPLPGERLGTASGQSRLTDEYWTRQTANQKAVENAQRALDAARGAK